MVNDCDCKGTKVPFYGRLRCYMCSKTYSLEDT